MPVTTKRHDEHGSGRGVDGLNRLLDPRNIPGFADSCGFATEGQERLLKALGLLSLEPRGNLDRIHGLVKVLKALEYAGLV